MIKNIVQLFLYIMIILIIFSSCLFFMLFNHIKVSSNRQCVCVGGGGWMAITSTTVKFVTYMKKQPPLLVELIFSTSTLRLIIPVITCYMKHN